ncbi:MAG TPA: hypothetical protein P5186_20350 [Candidatus Paceibacterota bacterium]|nr:hypothetical protein [Candidatus Paceibacterota bacterium]
MSKPLSILALMLALAAADIWLVTGGNGCWTKTSVPVKTVDEITGLEAVNYERRFVPGLEFLGAALLGASLLAGGSFLFCKKQTTNSNTPKP